MSAHRNPLEALLRLCGDLAPQPWFPRAHAAQLGVPWEALSLVLESLWLEGLIRKAGATQEAGPSFVLTELGRRVLDDPALLQRLCDEGTIAPPGDRGAAVRAILHRPARTIVGRLLVLANVAVFIVGVVLAQRAGKVPSFLAGPSLRTGAIDRATLSLYHRNGAMNGLDLLRGEWWRVVSSGFVHAGLFHLIMNLLMLVGANLIVIVLVGLSQHGEVMWGRSRFLVIYFVALLGGSCAAVAFRPEVIGMGASGALCGLLAAEAIWLVLNARYLPRMVVTRWRSGLIASFVLLFAISMLPGVSGWGHGGGAIAGAAAALCLNYQRFGKPRWRWLALLGLVPIVAAGFVAIDEMRRRSESWHRVEQQDFEQRYLRQISRAGQAAESTFRESAAPLLQRRPERRDVDQVPAAISALHAQRARLTADLLGLDKARYHDEAAHEAAGTGARYLQCWNAALEQATYCLERGGDCTAADEKELQVRLAAAIEARTAWQGLIR